MNPAGMVNIQQTVEIRISSCVSIGNRNTTIITNTAAIPNCAYEVCDVAACISAVPGADVCMSAPYLLLPRSVSDSVPIVCPNRDI